MRVILIVTLLLALSVLIEGRMLRVSKQKNRSKFRRDLVGTKECGTGWGSFNQWDPAWKSEVMITKTIGAVGCAITSATNAMKSRIPKVLVGGAEVDVNPANINKYLKEHNGYTSDVADCKNCIKWASLNTVGVAVHMVYDRMISAPTFAELKTEIEACNGVLLNVRGGGHWVLATSAAEADKFLVKDPGFDSTSYPIAAVKKAVIYKFKEDTSAAGQVQGEAAAAPAEEAAAAPVQTATPPEGEAAAAAAAAVVEDHQDDVSLSQADIDLLLASNGGNFGGDGGPGVMVA